MSDSALQWHSLNDLILPHPDPSRPRVLLLEASGLWRLPRIEIPDVGAGGLDRLCLELRRTLGLDATILRPARREDEDSLRRIHMTYVLEIRDPAWIPPETSRWVGRAELGALICPKQFAVLDDYLAERESGSIPEQRPAWCRMGWLDKATAWIREQLAGLGRTLVGPIEPIRNWSISCVLRAPTESGAVYFKAAPTLSLCVNEPVLLAALARRFPDCVPRPLSVEPELRWMLLPDLGKPIGRKGTPEAREEMLRILGRLQLAAAREVPGLLEEGCLDRRIARLPEQAMALAKDPGSLHGLTEVELQRFQEELPRFGARCVALAACGLPETLVHGDLHLNNVAGTPGHYQLFDWTDACISHPFLDLMGVFHERDLALQERMRDVYLDAWKQTAPRERLLEAWILARPLVDLHQAISYQHILAGLEPSAQGDFDGAVAYHLREMLRALDAEERGVNI